MAPDLPLAVGSQNKLSVPLTTNHGLAWALVDAKISASLKVIRMNLEFALDPHLAFEAIAYGCAITLYFYLRHRAGRTQFPPETILWLICGCMFGAWLGSKLLVLLENRHHFVTYDSWLRLLAGGKSAVGAILGGWMGIEFTKHKLQLRTQTGEYFVYPLAVGTAIGRLGCFVTGLDDQTHGAASSLPWAVDFGDGVARHPTQLYETIYVITLAGVLHLTAARRARSVATLFRLYLAGYFAFRLALDFLKPRETLILNLDATQIACALALFWLIWRRGLIPPPLTARAVSGVV